MFTKTTFRSPTSVADAVLCVLHQSASVLRFKFNLIIFLYCTRYKIYNKTITKSHRNNLIHDGHGPAATDRHSVHSISSVRSFCCSSCSSPCSSCNTNTSCPSAVCPDGSRETVTAESDENLIKNPTAKVQDSGAFLCIFNLCSIPCDATIWYSSDP